MPLTWDAIQGNAISFSKQWKTAHSEEAQAQAFELDFFKVFGIAALEVGDFEYRVPKEIEGKGYIDYLWKSKIAIEMKTKGKDLEKAYKQLKDYVIQLPAEEIPDLLMVCDFETIVLYRRGKGERKKFKVKDLSKNIRQFSNIAGYEITRELEDQLEVNVKAAEKMAVLHDALKASGYEGHDLEVYLVRLLFCLFADDTGIFPQQSFLNYIENSKTDGSDLSDRIARLFEVLNMPDEVRAKRTLLSADLKQFRYINGGLFANPLPYADFDSKMRQILIDCSHFAWNEISPAIFGAMFQGVMDKNQRRELGAHYTSEENILKLINPLFLDELWKELEQVRYDEKLLDRFHEKLGTLKFLDPACGCGNFLIITYRELRRLELEILNQKAKNGQMIIDISTLLKVSVEQFYGIEYEDFPCQIAQVGMWLMDHQMNMRAAEQFGMYYARLPLTQSATIVHGNALRIDWSDVVPKRELSYILGNPPFIGHQWRTNEQVADMELAFKDLKKHGKLDYVSAWYSKAAEYMQKTVVRCSFVSTNSIVQGESVPILWEFLFEKKHIEIQFAYRSFDWSNEAAHNAGVYCVIIGFTTFQIPVKKKIFEDEHTLQVNHINGYLTAGAKIYVQVRSKNINPTAPKIIQGNKPWDGGYLILNEQEYLEFILKYPELESSIRLFLGSNEFIKNIKRYCFWLKGLSPSFYRNNSEIRRRLEGVANTRQSTRTLAVQKQADTPMLFSQIRQPDSDYLCIPEVSSERRKYIPIGYLSKDVIASNKLFIIPEANLYLFGLLTSNVHMAWMRTVAGRLELRYSYSPAVYNNFPWPDATDEQSAEIEKLSQSVLDVRALFPDSSLADLYDPLTMPPELLKAHRNLDRAVMKLYGFTPQNTPTEADCVAKLMERYQKLVSTSE